MLQTLPEFSTVKLNDDYERDGLALPAGAVGTIVDILPGSYTVEFFEPIRVVETVAETLVTPIDQTRNISQMPPARYAALRRMMLEDGVPEDQIDAAIARHHANGMTIMVPSDEELRAMQARGELPSDEELRRAIS